jgi:hypothetical protein
MPSGTGIATLVVVSRVHPNHMLYVPTAMCLYFAWLFQYPHLATIVPTGMSCQYFSHFLSPARIAADAMMMINDSFYVCVSVQHVTQLAYKSA